MLQVHKDNIISNLPLLVDETDLQSLVRELLKRHVFSEEMIDRILNSSQDIRQQKTELYLAIQGRGPKAYAELRNALLSTNHTNLARILDIMETQNPSQVVHRSSSLNSVGSNVHSSDDSDGPSLPTLRKTSFKGQGGGKPPDSFPQTLEQAGAQGHSNGEPSKVLDLYDFPNVALPSPNSRVSALPAYAKDLFDERQKRFEEDYTKVSAEKFQPVNVIYSKDWHREGVGKPEAYKMDSNPRGYALIVNNLDFRNAIELPKRVGADNDHTRLKELLEKFHFVVEDYVDKTKKEMEDIVKTFSQKIELNKADCIWVTFMSHGQEGTTAEDSEILGIDGIGYKTEDIVSTFYNDNCKALIRKPKIFAFQACRGNLCDPGVWLGNLDISRRTETDGKRVSNTSKPVVTRTQEDILIAYPTPPGITANRDRLTGAWFIQAIVDVFSKYACTSHLDDLLKMVDKEIKRMNNLYTGNFQSVTTKTIGWNKNLYFNPGLWRDEKGATIRLRKDSQSDEGMDVVDSSTTTTTPTDYGITPNGISSYHHDKEKDKEDSVQTRGKIGCFHFSGCNPI